MPEITELKIFLNEEIVIPVGIERRKIGMVSAAVISFIFYELRLLFRNIPRILKKCGMLPVQSVYPLPFFGYSEKDISYGAIKYI